MPQPDRGTTTMIRIRGNRRSESLNARMQPSVQVLKLLHDCAKTGELLLTLHQLILHRCKLFTNERRGNPRKGRISSDDLRSIKPAINARPRDHLKRVGLDRDVHKSPVDILSRRVRPRGNCRIHRKKVLRGLRRSTLP